MVESDRHEGPATHALTFVWTGQEVTDDFQCDESAGNFKEHELNFLYRI